MIFRQNTKELFLRTSQAKNTINKKRLQKARFIEEILGELSIATSILKRLKQKGQHINALEIQEKKILNLKKKLIELESSINP